jgi:hypothetical protein
VLSCVKTRLPFFGGTSGTFPPAWSLQFAFAISRAHFRTGDSPIVERRTVVFVIEPQSSSVEQQQRLERAICKNRISLQSTAGMGKSNTHTRCKHEHTARSAQTGLCITLCEYLQCSSQSRPFSFLKAIVQQHVYNTGLAMQDIRSANSGSSLPWPAWKHGLCMRSLTVCNVTFHTFYLLQLDKAAGIWWTH